MQMLTTAKKEAANGKEWGDPAGGLNADI